MARRALLVGINDYQSIRDLRGCVNDVENMRNVLKTCLGFGNNDIRVLLDDRATKDQILRRLNWMVDNAAPGDLMFFHFSGHGSQIRDRGEQDELNDHMDEILCTWGMSDSWDNGNYIVDDDLDKIFQKIPKGAAMEVFLDCCHSGWDTGPATGSYRSLSQSFEEPSDDSTRYRYLSPPRDIAYRHEDEEDYLKAPQRFTGGGSMARHVVWAGCQANQVSADARIGGTYNGAFTYTFCKCMRDAGGNISRGELIQRVRDVLRNQNYKQIPMLETGTDEERSHRPLQFSTKAEEDRLLFYTKPNMRGNDVMKAQEALANRGYDIRPDGAFGPHTRVIVMRFQERNGLTVDGVVGPALRRILFG